MLLCFLPYSTSVPRPRATELPDEPPARIAEVVEFKAPLFTQIARIVKLAEFVSRIVELTEFVSRIVELVEFPIGALRVRGFRWWLMSFSRKLGVEVGSFSPLYMHGFFASTCSFCSIHPDLLEKVAGHLCVKLCSKEAR